MTTIHELKETILEMEKVAHEYERDAQEADTKDDAYFTEMLAGMYRIAAACCWEKLESQEAGDGWFRPEKGELPPEGKTVLALVSGSPTENITLHASYQTAVYIPDEGWAIDEWPEWKTPEVICWQNCPEVPEEVLRLLEDIETGAKE